jgi:hypothetical protein
VARDDGGEEQQVKSVGGSHRMAGGLISVSEFRRWRCFLAGLRCAAYGGSPRNR